MSLAETDAPAGSLVDSQFSYTSAGVWFVVSNRTSTLPFTVSNPPAVIVGGISREFGGSGRRKSSAFIRKYISPFSTNAFGRPVSLIRSIFELRNSGAMVSSTYQNSSITQSAPTTQQQEMTIFFTSVKLKEM